jgi:hypothetical protein
MTPRLRLSVIGGSNLAVRLTFILPSRLLIARSQGLTKRCSQPLAVEMSTDNGMKQLSMLAKLAFASGG